MFKDRFCKNLGVPVVLGVIFIISRVLYNEAGIRFDAGTINRTWHFIDIYLLKNDLWRSVFYLHTQPPLMNLLTGIGLQLFPATYAGIFHVFFLIGGFLLTLAIYFLGIRLYLPKYLSAVLAAWFALSPATVVFENYFFYSYPTTILLTLSAVFLARFLDKKRAVDGLLFSMMLAANALTWSLFHLVWLLGCFGIITFLLKGYRRKALWLVPAFLLVFAWYAKNGILYNSFTASTWAGHNVFKTVTVRIPGEVRKRWVKEGMVSEMALIAPYRSPDVYLQFFPDTPVTGIPLLDDINMSNGYRNQHHLSYVYADERFLKDSVRIIIHAPRYYLTTIPYSIYIFLHSASDYEHTLNIRGAIDSLDTWWNRLFYGQWQKDESSFERLHTFSPDHLGWGLALGFLIVVTVTPVYLWLRRSNIHSPDSGLVLFMFWNILFVSATGILLDLGENNRTRFGIDPFLLLLGVFFMLKVIRATRNKLKT
ncbi:MAG: hypothetical protein JW963_08190 [Anaerolineales bacterium]|nr:hypothetical protein [Anaerolineales bacterium]